MVKMAHLGVPNPPETHFSAETHIEPNTLERTPAGCVDTQTDKRNWTSWKYSIIYMLH